MHILTNSKLFHSFMLSLLGLLLILGHPILIGNTLFSPFSIISINILHLFVQTDRAAMLDEIVEYVRFLRLQVKVD